MVRVNAVDTEWAERDVDEVVSAYSHVSSPHRHSHVLAHNAHQGAARSTHIRPLTAQLRTRNIQAIALPKTNDPSHLAWLASRIDELCPPEKRRGGNEPVRIIGMIESAEAMVKIHDIAKAADGYLDGLLFAAEDCVSLCPRMLCVATPSGLQRLLLRPAVMA